jgi:hypothetical protein
MVLEPLPGVSSLLGQVLYLDPLRGDGLHCLDQVIKLFVDGRLAGIHNVDYRLLLARFAH